MDKKCKYYPMEVTREVARDLGIDEKELVFQKIGRRKTLCVLVPTKDEEQYKELMRPIWREEKANERKLKRQATGERQILSMEHLKDEFDLEIASNFDVEKEVLSNDLRKALDSAFRIVLVEEIDKKIIKMFMEDKTEKEIATEVGMSQKGVNKRKHKIFKNLKIILKDFSS